MATVKDILQNLQAQYKQHAAALDAQQRAELKQAIEQAFAKAKQLQALDKEVDFGQDNAPEESKGIEQCYRITIEDDQPAVLGSNGIWTTTRTITKTKMECKEDQTFHFSMGGVHSLIENPNSGSDPTTFALFPSGDTYNFQDIVDFFGIGSPTWKLVRDMKFKAGEASQTLTIAWGGNATQEEFTYLIRDSGPPTQQQNGFVLTRTIQKISLSPAQAPDDYIQIQGNVYAQNLSVDEIIRRRDDNNATFNTVAASGATFNRTQIVGLFGQNSSTWQQFLELERDPRAGQASFEVVWSFDPGQNANGTGYEPVTKQLLAQRHEQIMEINGNITACDTADAKRTYLQFLLEFQRTYLSLNPDNPLRTQYDEFYTGTVVPEMASVQTDINNITEPVGQINNLESNRTLMGKAFKITTGVNAKTNQIAGRLYYVEDTGSPSMPMRVEYFKDHAGETKQIEYLLNTPNAQQVQEGFAAQLLARAAILIRAGQLVPGGGEEDLFAGPTAMHMAGSSNLRVKAPIGVPVPLLFTVSDGNMQVTAVNQCGQPTNFTIDRVVQLAPNPSCLPSGFAYNAIIAADQSTGADIGNPFTTIPDNPAFVNTNLPATAINAATPTLAQMTAFFNANPNATNFVQTMPFAVPPPPPPGNITINTGYWNVVISDPAAALAALQPLIDFLCFFPTQTVQILGFLDYTGDPTIPYGPPGGAPVAPGGSAFPAGVTPPAGVTRPIDYVRAKALLVQNFIQTNFPAIGAGQLVVPPAGSSAIMANVVNNRTLAQTISVTLL